MIITKAIAIEFFQLRKAISKYHIDDKYDSLPAKLKSNRQLIYRAIDQYGVYETWYRPKLDSMNIKIIEGDFTDSILTFKNGNTSYIIDIIILKKMMEWCFINQERNLFFGPIINQNVV
ncbi:MAG: hypothetical protein K2X86_10345 [Cytophagaceae bacterium]|nr:hypothetical protein [Cytophagaceae bacterium]